MVGWWLLIYHSLVDSFGVFVLCWLVGWCLGSENPEEANIEVMVFWDMTPISLIKWFNWFHIICEFSDIALYLCPGGPRFESLSRHQVYGLNFSVFSAVSLGKFRTRTSIRPWLLFFKSFPIYHSLIFVPSGFIRQRFSTCVVQHSGVTQRVSWCAAWHWRKVEKKQENLRNKKSTINFTFKNKTLIGNLAAGLLTQS